MFLPFAVRTGPFKRFAVLVWLTVYLCATAWADNIPPKPSTYFYDPSHLISERIGDQINLALEQFERKTSDQVLVAIFPDLPEGEALEDFTQRTAEAWKAGQKGKDNGVILFIFVHSHQIRIEVGYGLEGALPDITAHKIITEEIAPAFKVGDFTTGIIRGVNSIFSAIQGEYQGTGSLVSEQGGGEEEAPSWLPFLFFGFLLFLFFLMALRNRSGYQYGPFGGSRGMPIFMPFLGRGDDGGSGFGGFGGGGFSGGGGGFGGGGASGGW